MWIQFNASIKIISPLNSIAIITSIAISGICRKVSASLKNNDNINDSINSSNNDVSDYSNDDERLTSKIVILKLKPFFCCNIVSRSNWFW